MDSTTMAEIDTIYESLLSKSRTCNGCILYENGVDGNAKYHRIKRKLDSGRSIHIYVHQLALLVKTRTLTFPSDLECSHLCHNKACISTEHIVSEPHGINMNRKACYNERIVRNLESFCFGHPGYENCK